MNIHQSIGTGRAVSGQTVSDRAVSNKAVSNKAVSDKDTWTCRAQDSTNLAKVSSGTRPTGIILSDNGQETAAFLSEYYDVYCYTHRNARLAAPRFDATKLQFVILGWAHRERTLNALAWIRTISNLPVIVIGPASEPECVAALEGGAADYIIDSVGRRELLARVRAVLRYHQPAPKRESLAEGYIYEFGGWRYDAPKRRLTGPQGLNVALTRSEYALLSLFLNAPTRVMTRESLLRATGGVADRSIDLLILRLRRKLSAVAPEDSIISTERGAGYRFAMAVRRHSLPPTDVDERNRRREMSGLIRLL